MIDFDRFVEPLAGDSPCGADCEYDNDFLALSQATAGKPEQQFGDTVIPAVDPDWREVDSLATAMLERTRDLRVVGWLSLANTHLHGATAFTTGLRLMHALCERYWDAVHPRVEVDGESDPYLRMNAVAAFSGTEYSGEDRLLQALRASVLIRQPLTLTYRDVELAFTNSPDAPYAVGQVESMLRDSMASGNAEIDAITEAFDTYLAFRQLLEDKVSAADLPDFDCLVNVLKPVALGIRNLSSAQATGTEYEATADGSNIAAPGASVPGGSGLIQSRDDARRALERVCDYLERHEPSNPAALFARRAQRMLNMSFLDIMRELSPDSMSHLEMLTGANAQQQDSSSSY